MPLHLLLPLHLLELPVVHIICPLLGCSWPVCLLNLALERTLNPLNSLKTLVICIFLIRGESPFSVSAVGWADPCYSDEKLAGTGGSLGIASPTACARSFMGLPLCLLVFWGFVCLFENVASVVWRNGIYFVG